MLDYTNWQEVCNNEREIYVNKEHRESVEMTDYAKHIMNNNRLFVEMLRNSYLHEKSRVLDLAGSRNPWFSYLSAASGFQTFTYDFVPPHSEKILAQHGITYITDDVNNVNNHSAQLQGLDFILCRGFSPAQFLRDWYDPQFKQIWHSILGFLNQTGIIYWIQMTNGSGNPDKSGSFFANLSAKYFHTFFVTLGVDFRITKYGYMVFKVAKTTLPQKWTEYYIGDTSNKENLLASSDFASLIKWYALQLQLFYEKMDYNLDQVITITGTPIGSNIARLLLLNNFRFRDARITGMSDTTQLHVEGHPIFELEDIGPKQDSYFLIDEQEDKRFTNEYLNLFNR